MMPPSSLDIAAAMVLMRYPSFCRHGAPVPLGNQGGFSGAALWRIDGPTGAFCLRAWPSHETWPRLLFRHRLMTQARRAGLSFVPTIFATTDGASALEQAGRLWELIEWLPGRADFHEYPSAKRLEAAGSALAQLHSVWRRIPSEQFGPSAVRRRLTFLEEWHRRVRSGWRPLPVADDPLRPLVERAWKTLPSALERLPHVLQPWCESALRLQPCLCDPWHDHLLFDGDHLTGLIDYGAVKVDLVAVDVGRMLGSLVQADGIGWQTGLRAYRRFAPFSAEEEALAHVLDETGIVLGVANWLRWLYEEYRPFADRSAVACRFAELAERLESMAQ
jgi:Ser/Thr protein kinase RdoA (MazF antagonist)